MLGKSQSGWANESHSQTQSLRTGLQQPLEVLWALMAGAVPAVLPWGSLPSPVTAPGGSRAGSCLSMVQGKLSPACRSLYFHGRNGRGVSFPNTGGQERQFRMTRIRGNTLSETGRPLAKCLVHGNLEILALKSPPVKCSSEGGRSQANTVL
jgi:hypothetical protein